MDTRGNLGKERESLDENVAGKGCRTPALCLQNAKRTPKMPMHVSLPPTSATRGGKWTFYLLSNKDLLY